MDKWKFHIGNGLLSLEYSGKYYFQLPSKWAQANPSIVRDLLHHVLMQQVIPPIQKDLDAALGQLGAGK